MTPRIATCCYCGTRAALILDQKRHELSCASCGAPLHNLKRMPVDGFAGMPDGRTPKVRKKYNDPLPYPEVRKPKKKYKKKRKSLFQVAIEEAFDAIEDIFD